MRRAQSGVRSHSSSIFGCINGSRRRKALERLPTVVIRN